MSSADLGLPSDQLADALAGCENEPIRVPGAIQPHGALLACTEHDLTCVLASANAEALLGRDPVGRPLAQLIGAVAAHALTRADADDDFADVNPLHVELGGGPADLVAHRTGALVVVEVEPLVGTQDSGEWHRRMPQVLQRLSATESLAELAATVAVEMRRLTGYDRVMVYRFDPEWNGEVIAEDARTDLESFLGLRYPAADIPSQARAMYATNWLRIIPDATYSPVPLVPRVDPSDGRPLDLSGAMLRSVSPVHLEYLANMGVRSSMSVSLIDHGKLWGLIACHHYSGAHRPSYRDRVAAEFLGRTASLLIATKQDTTDRDAVLEVSRRQGAIAAALASAPRTAAAVLATDEALLRLLPASGAALRLEGRLTLLGTTPERQRVETLVRALFAARVPATDSLVSVLPDTEDVVATASGVLAVPVGGGGDFLAWFRGEALREIDWGGDPRKSSVVEGTHGLRLSPRESFTRWTEIVRATAAPWRPHEVTAARALAAQLAEVALRKSEYDNKLALTLQRTLLMDKLPTVPGVTLAARYAPSTNDVVGGDWYDLVVLPSGKLCLVLGDVAGHGLGAAAITAQLRHALRAQLLRDAGPGAALKALNDLMTHLLPDEMATAVIAELDPATGALTVATAGHPPVLLVTGASSRFVNEARGPALGVRAASQYGQAELRLSSDAALVLYSDGLVERRRGDIADEEDRMAEAAVRAPRDPDAVLEAILGAVNPPDDDDVTLLAVRLNRPPG